MPEKKVSKNEQGFLKWIFIGAGVIIVGFVLLTILKNSSQENRLQDSQATSGTQDSFSDEGAQNAIELVHSLTEVKQFEEAVMVNNRSEFSIYVESGPQGDSPYHTIAVTEFFPDHRTVFNRYRVGEDNTIFKYDVVSDSWTESN